MRQIAMLAFRKCCSAAARASSKSLYQWRHAQTMQAVMGRGAWPVELPRSTWRFSSWPPTTPTSPFLRPMLLLPTRGAKRGTMQGTPPLTTKLKNSGQHDKNQDPDAKSTSDLFTRWEIPWDGKTVVITMTAIGISCLITGLITGLAVRGVIIGFNFNQGQALDSDQISLIGFASLVLQTLVVTYVMKACIKSYSPLPKGLFSYDWRDPFSARRGWLLWGIVGTFCSIAAVLLTSILTDRDSVSRWQDVVVKLLPLIGASGTSTALVLASTGILAPILEEIVFRGFLLTSLTKWVPTYVAVLGSAGAFALAHFSPEQFPQLFALGVVSGFSYSKSGNLLTPIMMHSLWNSTAILLLYLLRQRYDIQKLIESPTVVTCQPVNQAPHCEGKE